MSKWRRASVSAKCLFVFNSQRTYFACRSESLYEEEGHLPREDSGVSVNECINVFLVNTVHERVHTRTGCISTRPIRVSWIVALRSKSSHVGLGERILDYWGCKHAQQGYLVESG